MQWAIITGGVLEFVGGLVLVWQLGLVRTVETGAPPWLLELNERVMTPLKSIANRSKPLTIEATGTGTFEFSGTAIATLTEPDPPPSNPTVAQAMAWIQRKMESTSELLEQGRRTTKEELDATIKSLEALMRELLAELEATDLERRIERSRSGNWQALGTFFILLGVILSTVGAAT